MNYVLIFLPVLVTFTAWVMWLVPREVFINGDMIKADGSNNTLHAGFHSRRTWVRFWQGLACVLAGSLPTLWVGVLPAVFCFAGLAILLAGFFAATFTPALNVYRGLPKYYVSFAEGAAKWPDSKLAAEARAKCPDSPEQQAVSASFALAQLTNKIIFASAVIAGVLLSVAAVWVASRS